jgi:hypothetical protein
MTIVLIIAVVIIVLMMLAGCAYYFLYKGGNVAARRKRKVRARLAFTSKYSSKCSLRSPYLRVWPLMLYVVVVVVIVSDKLSHFSLVVSFYSDL